MSQLRWDFQPEGSASVSEEGVLIAPMQRAVNAAAEALRGHWDRQDAMSIEDCCARIAITAAYPHLFQSLAKENRELRAKLADLSES